ncbi:MAG: STAS domain-containing protein [Clostridia bacterium]|nr:STAS domain-containing protein [Clostridia bacterium]MBR1704704.1 STAS domain-containing protein [Clostridia bacterium]
MLQITTERNQAELAVTLSGRLDTVTAPDLSETLKDLSGITNIVMDCADLSYVSSAGLRVLLTARKSISGELILEHVAPSVLDVLDITGFTGILTIR